MVLAVIPARFASTRFPGKPLVQIQGKTMVQRVFEQVSKVASIQEVVVATDDARIFDHVHSFGGKAVMTKAEHPSGTDRCAEVCKAFPDAKWVLNIQGDEPFIQPEQIELLLETIQASNAGIATLAKQLTEAAQLSNPNLVKVVRNQQGNALYFSRHPVPYCRGVDPSEWTNAGLHFKHIGLYAFQRSTLLEITQLPPSPLEKAESLEQLRWLEYGFTIQVGLTDLETIGIDTPEDLERLH
jgi:3-deoxy-manno-octulosonate cytidylyltransferase (CMP-KDO synthetase)